MGKSYVHILCTYSQRERRIHIYPFSFRSKLEIYDSTNINVKTIILSIVGARTIELGSGELRLSNKALATRVATIRDELGWIGSDGSEKHII